MRCFLRRESSFLMVNVCVMAVVKDVAAERFAAHGDDGLE